MNSIEIRNLQKNYSLNEVTRTGQIGNNFLFHTI